MSARRALARLLLPIELALCLVAAPAARAQSPADLGAPVGFVNDRAGVMDEAARAKLEGFLDQLKQKTGAEFAVLTVKSTAPLDPSDYKVQVFQSWKLGKKGEDNGLLMLVAVDEHQVRFETGYGLEGTLPDGLESRIVREQMAPLLRPGDYTGAITAGVLACAARIAAEKGVILEWNGRELRYTSDRERNLPPGAVAILVFFVIVMFVLRAAGMGGRRRGWYVGPGGWGGGFGGFGGGFGGGGGGGGGGFGGFGGGSSGGGGGGGSW
jgi:uncharacterized protein